MTILYSTLAKVLELPFVQNPIFSTKGAVFAMFLLVYASKAIQVALSIALLGKYDVVQASYRNNNIVEGSSFFEKLVHRSFNAHQVHVYLFAHIYNMLQSFTFFS